MMMKGYRNVTVVTSQPGERSRGRNSKMRLYLDQMQCQTCSAPWCLSLSRSSQSPSCIQSNFVICDRTISVPWNRGTNHSLLARPSALVSRAHRGDSCGQVQRRSVSISSPSPSGLRCSINHDLGIRGVSLGNMISSEDARN